MKQTIRILNTDDYPHMQALDTGIKNDYVKTIFNKLTTGNNRLFGLFLDQKMVSLGGYSVFAKHYAMLGRLRSDRQYKNQGFSTTLMNYVINDAFQQNDIQWIGGNTQENNISGQRVLEKIGLSRQITLYGAVTQDISPLENGATPWNLLTDLKRKKSWIHEMYVKPAAFFPVECYYLFPGSTDLFPEEQLNQWNFYENDNQTRFLILKFDQKKQQILHAVYPWNDIASQSGLWETIARDYYKMRKQTEEDALVWIDLSKEAAHHLPPGHPLELPSPWILFGIDKVMWNFK